MSEWNYFESFRVLWNNGTLEQRSQFGLLRSLLFEVLREYTDLIPIVLPWLWARQYSATLDPSSVSEHSQLPFPQVKEAFATLVHQKKVPLKLCVSSLMVSTSTKAIMR